MCGCEREKGLNGISLDYNIIKFLVNTFKNGDRVMEFKLRKTLLLFLYIAGGIKLLLLLSPKRIYLYRYLSRQEEAD